MDQEEVVTWLKRKCYRVIIDKNINHVYINIYTHSHTHTNHTHTHIYISIYIPLDPNAV